MLKVQKLQLMNLRINKPVDHHPSATSENPLVSVCVQTYQHAKYIEKCLEGILMQKTNFEFEILLGEDGSSDKTREICINYANKFPNKIKLFLHHRENNIEINGKPTGRFNLIYNLLQAKGEYIALCEGDDYWSCEFKLQKQVDFLDNNSTYSGCAHNVEVSYEDHFDREILFYKNDMSTLEEALHYFYPTCSMVFRAKFVVNTKGLEIFYKPLSSGDKIIQLLLFKNGPLKYLDSKMAVYRKHSRGMSYENSSGKHKEAILFMKIGKQLFDKQYSKLFRYKLFINFGENAIEEWRNRNYKEWITSLINSLLCIRSFRQIKIFTKDFIIKA